MLLKAGADPNVPVEGFTPLFSATVNCHPEIVEALLAGGARRDVKNARAIPENPDCRGLG
jgi:ankyrin repeat protein